VEFGDDDEVVTLCEIFTTIEAIICIDMQNDNKPIQDQQLLFM
jgi:hypothetical protein